MCNTVTTEVKWAAVIWTIFCGLHMIYMSAHLYLLKETPLNTKVITFQALQDDTPPVKKEKTKRRQKRKTLTKNVSSPYAKKRGLATAMLVTFLIFGAVGMVSSVLLFIYGAIKENKAYCTYFLGFGAVYLLQKIAQIGFDFAFKQTWSGGFGIIGFRDFNAILGNVGYGYGKRNSEGQTLADFLGKEENLMR